MRKWCFNKVGRAKRALALAVAMMLPLALPQAVYADEEDDKERAEIEAQIIDVSTKIDDAVQELDNLSAEIVATQDRVKEIEEEMSSVLGEIEATQEKFSRLQRSASDTAVQLYKDREAYNPLLILQSGTSLTDVIWRLDMSERVFDRYEELIYDTKQVGVDLEKKYDQVSQKKNEENELIEELKVKSEKVDKQIENLQTRKSELDKAKQEVIERAAAKAAAAEAAAKAAERAAKQKAASTFETGSLGNLNIKWKTGLASAYGGESDKSTTKEELTATGTVCDDWSIGVAVPMAWGPTNYYGRYVEISYEGRSIIAPVVDCGDMDGGRRALDLQPGVFKAFGCKTADDWGVREVQYRFI